MAELNVPDRTFFEGDNLPILQRINSESIDLIATDPPFNKRRNMSGRAGKYLGLPFGLAPARCA